ncbi:MAG: hypothetical protein AB7F59_11135 [Bdellovibrionales bacterium]
MKAYLYTLILVLFPFVSSAQTPSEAGPWRALTMMEVANSDEILKCSYCLLSKSSSFTTVSYGGNIEAGAWIVRNGDQASCIFLRNTQQDSRITINPKENPRPGNAIALIHSHPMDTSPKLSPGDFVAAQKLNMPVLSVGARAGSGFAGIWSYSPPRPVAPEQIKDESEPESVKLVDIEPILDAGKSIKNIKKTMDRDVCGEIPTVQKLESPEL